MRALRERRKTLEDELGKAWQMQKESMGQRQQLEALRDRLDWSLKVDQMSKEQIELTRTSLVAQIEAAKKARQQAASQLAARQERIAKREQAAEAESLDVDVPQPPGRTSAVCAGPPVILQSQEEGVPAAADTNGEAPAAQPQKQSTLTRVLSFGKRPKPKPAEGEEGEGLPTRGSPIMEHELGRKLSLARGRARRPVVVREI